MKILIALEIDTEIRCRYLVAGGKQDSQVRRQEAQVRRRRNRAVTLAKTVKQGYTDRMQITVDLPKDIAQRPDPAREALEALAIEGYRSGALTSFETRDELDGFLKAHNVWEHAYNIEDLERDCETLQELEDKSK